MFFAANGVLDFVFEFIFTFFGRQIIGLFGIFMVVWAIRALVFEVRRGLKSRRTKGTVVDHAPIEGGHGKECFQPVVEFQDEAGITQRLTVLTAGRADLKHPPVGTKVPILYQANQAVMDTIGSRFGGALFSAFWGLLFILAAIHGPVSISK